MKALRHPADFMPTILELLNVPRPARVQGESLVGVLEEKAEHVREFTVSGPAVHTPGLWRPITVTTPDGWSLIHTGLVGRKAGHEIFAVDGMPRQETMPAKITGPELYHLPSDPAQQHNVIERQAGLAEELRAAYTAWFRRLGVPEEALRPREKLWMD